MRVSIIAKETAKLKEFERHIEKKIAKLERYFRNLQSVQIEQTTERGMFIVELNVEGDGVFLRSEERCNDLYAAVDNAVDKMERQVKRFKTRVRRGRQRPGPVKEMAADQAAGYDSDTSDEDETGEEEDTAPVLRITRRKRFAMKPMSAEEAARQMELVDHDFFLFMNEETGNVSTLYRRRDGDYGLIELQS